MIRTIVIDDEKLICEGICKIIRENVPDMQIIASLQNGEECLTYLETNKADLIICDIRMPRVDGLTLIQILHSRYGNNLDFVIVSGYDDFNYCRTALRYNVYDYVLKPLDKAEFINMLKRYCIEHNADDSTQEVRSERADVHKIKAYLRTHYREKPSLEELSEVFYLSPNYISQLFRHHVGMTITDYIVRIRMEMARAYLRDPSRSISEISMLVGYSDPRQFSMAFHKVEGLTPSEYRLK